MSGSERVVAVIQARLGSSRLPGKVLQRLTPAGTVLDWTWRRVSRAQTVADTVVATSDRPEDDELVAYCERAGYRVHRGSLHDVLARVRGAAEAAGATTVVRITADCPLVDPTIVDRVVTAHLGAHNDFTADRLPPPHHRTYPIGLDVEVASMSALRRADAEAREPAHREHVMPYFYAGPGDFKIEILQSDLGDHGAVRWTIDTPADLAAIRALLARPGFDDHTPWGRLLAAWQADPALAALNASVVQKSATDVDLR